ncbi:MAG: hypothetical protein MI867_15850, partial [Pseudomonadales bacterium]|nr:hypothetical protein [Pseudomonadales bacterium]
WDAKIPLLKKPLDMIECSFLDECEDHIDEHCEVVNGLLAGKQMCIYPEESYHSFRHRYTLFKFSSHVARYAQKANVPIVPVNVIGAEEAAPTLIGMKKAKVPLHVPFHLPIILPLKITIDIGLPIQPQELELVDNPEEMLRQRMYSTISKYRKCKLSDDKYIDKSSWLF